MTRQTLYSATIGLLLSLTSYSQTPELKKIDNDLTTTYKKFASSNDESLRFEKLGPAFKKQLLLHLTNPLTFNNSLDSLSKYINIKSSADNKVKFYSWDNLEGGSWHTMESFAQFKSNNGKIIVQPIVTADTQVEVNYTDSEIYEVYAFSVDSNKYYLTFAWGTHGSGMQHKIAQIFSIKADSLVKCKSCFANNMDLIIEYPRVDTLKLAFNSQTNEITYNEVPSFEDNRFYGRPTKNIVTLKLDNGKFRVK